MDATPLLIDAKREYVGQLTDVMAPYVVNYIVNLFLATQKQRQATLVFQRALREIPLWNSATIRERTAEIQNKYTFLGDLIAACFVAYVKILSSVKLHSQKPNIRLKLPSNDAFVHKVYVHVARDVYANPALVHADRTAKLTLVKSAVEAAVRDMLPIEDILKAYLGNTVDSEHNTMNPAEFDAPDSPVAPSLPPPPPFSPGASMGPVGLPGVPARLPGASMGPSGLPGAPAGLPGASMGPVGPPGASMEQPLAQPPQQPPPAGSPGFGVDVFEPADDSSPEDAPKQISMSPVRVHQPQAPQDLFSDAEDEF